MKTPIYLKLILALIIFFGCKQSNESEIKEQLPAPDTLNDGWDVASPGSVGVDSENLIQLINKLQSIGEHRIHGIVLVKDNKLVFERYYPGPKFNLGQYTGQYGYTVNDKHVLCSATKSFTSALLGIAIDKGFIKSVDQKVFDFFPEYVSLITEEPDKADMTIRHLLTMTSGLMYDDESLPYTDTRNDMNRFYRAGDPIKFLLSQPLFAQPGAVYDYDNCNTNIIGRIVGKTVNKRIDRFAKEVLFDKLGITGQEWQLVNNEVVLCSGDLHLRPRDMAKFGLLFLNNGMWNGEQIVSKEWCGISTAFHIDPNIYTDEFNYLDGYGFQWWIKKYNHGNVVYHSYFAFGWGGQTIIILPELNSVAVTTAGNWYEPEIISPFEIVEQYIIPAIK